jgi:hypothetical protein
MTMISSGFEAQVHYEEWQETATNCTSCGVARPARWTIITLPTAQKSSRCRAAIAAQEAEPSLGCYEAARDSGVLGFWDDPEEDVYTMDDGEPV